MDEGRLREILSPETRLRQADSGVYSIYPEGQGANSYDRRGAMFFYDQVACNPVYNRLVWGYRTSAFAVQCRETLGAARPGWILDAGCGSLAFTAKVYAEKSDRPVVLLDQSLTLLRKAAARLIRLRGELPDNVALVHGDALATGFRPAVFGAVVCLNLLHVLADPAAFLSEMRRVGAPGAPMLLTTLIAAGRLGDRFLAMWDKAGELVARGPADIDAAFARAGFKARRGMEGNMAFIRAEAMAN